MSARRDVKFCVVGLLLISCDFRSFDVTLDALREVNPSRFEVRVLDASGMAFGGMMIIQLLMLHLIYGLDLRINLLLNYVKLIFS